MNTATSRAHRPEPRVPAELLERRLSADPPPARRRTGQHSDLVIACVLDEFSFRAFDGEADLAPLTMDNWLVEITAAQPDLLLVESAWRGYRGKWWNTVHQHGPELTGIVEWCRERGIPTAFWNKEDPVHFNTFLTTATLFDAVFTTDLDCVPRYKRHLGHDDVYFLPFAAQLADFNPAERYRRIDGCAFAGAYYERYPERTSDLRELSTELSAHGRRFDIYDRNLGLDMPGYMFPSEYEEYIVGGALTPELLDTPYKGYTSNLNLNSVKQSQSMFARRVFELMASNTLVISNFSRGLRNMFGDLVVASDSGSEIRRRLDAVEQEANGNCRLREMALRKVLSEHTYAHRLEFIASSVGIGPAESRPELVALVAMPENPQHLQAVIDSVQRQRHSDVVCILIGAEDDYQRDERFIAVTDSAAAARVLSDLGAEFVGALDPSDHYGANYVMDLVSHLRWADVAAVGHSEHFSVNDADEGELVVKNEGTAYSTQDALELTRSLVRLSHKDCWVSADLPSFTIDAKGPGFAVGTSEYCRGGFGLSSETLAPCSELEVDCGASLADLRVFSDQLPVEESNRRQLAQFDLLTLSNSFASSEHAEVYEGSNGRLHLLSRLAPGSHAYVNSDEEFAVDALLVENEPTIYIDSPPGLEFLLVLYYLDTRGKRLSHEFVRPRSNNPLSVPAKAVNVRLGFRISGSGSTQIDTMFLEKNHVSPRPIFTRSNTLLATNVYPTYSNLYRNGFIHARTRSYLEAGQKSEVLRIESNVEPEFAEFENIDSAWIGPQILDRTLTGNSVERVLVHFLDRKMWSVLSNHTEIPKIIVWIHGAEIQPWWRRSFNYTSEDELAIAKSASHERMNFWREVFTQLPDNFHFVFVSQHFAEENFEDLEMRLDEDRYSIIHNPIDTEIFTFSSKPPDQAKRILTIRPFASPKYANDLSVAAILALKDRPGFDELHFRIIGDGVLFDELLQPIANLENVTIERRFLNHEEIAAIHKDYGVFLTPTRGDSQGVSRDEAMASGLVPVTSATAAIPEFVDETCGFLARPENSEDLADAMWTIAHDDSLFRRLSESAAQRVRRQSSSDVIVPQELALIFG